MGSSNLELIFDSVGHFGRYQIFLYFICAFQNISCGIHYLASVFLSVSPQHTCRPPGNVSQVLFQDLSTWQLEDIWTQFSVGHEDHVLVQLQDGEIWELTRCQRFRRDDQSSLDYEYSGRKSSFPCLDGYIYDRSEWHSTVVTQWDLVCNREWLGRLIQPTFMFGVLLGAVIFGYLSDRAGRRLVLWASSTGVFLFGIAVAFTFDYYSFIVARFLLAISGSGYLVVVFVYVTEFAGMKSRTWASIHLHSFFAFGTMVVALTGYFVRTWWTYQIVLSSVTVPFILCCWMLPETPFWLISGGKYEEAQKVIDTMAKWNRTRSCKLSELLSLDHDGSAGCLGFYTFSLNSVHLGGSEYLNLFLMGVVEIPAYVFVCLGMDRMGRRNILIFSLLSSAVTNGVIMVIPKEYHFWLVVATMAGKFFIGAAFGLIYLYTAELYPTIVRSLAVGSGSTVGRVGSIVAPLCIYLSSIWIFMPQLLVGTLALVSGVLTFLLPETLRRPLTTTWDETEKESSSGKLLSTTSNTVLENVTVENSEDSSLNK
ncbi:solute carrier family 22 member 16 isoform X2 [Oryx dammah]|uniref:solute carrier family 22 member 16 isoform X2 n=1 Tax=Oryx dammah TaxID=59534 RepID=UPI001A9B7498|nr:solute carrier family 22 member 16 isoform X2 [Oryx dammah]